MIAVSRGTRSLIIQVKQVINRPNSDSPQHRHARNGRSGARYFPQRFKSAQFPRDIFYEPDQRLGPGLSNKRFRSWLRTI